MSVSIPTPLLAGLKAKLSSIDLPLIASIGSILGIFAVISYLQAPQLARLKQPTQHITKADLQAQEAKAKAQLLLMKNLPTFGFDNLVADWLFMGYLQYFADSDVRRQAGYGSAMDYFDNILDRDPRFFFAYFYLSNTGSLYAGQPERSVALINKGLKSLSPRVPDRSYYIWRLKAVDELLFLGKAGEARNSMQMASNWARQYPTEEGQNVAKLSQNTANYLARNPNSKQAQFDAWNMVINSAIDDAVIKRAIAEIAALGGKVTVSPTGAFKVEPPAKD
jgi:tetratricopeptide (TPR) repeat protein